MSDLISEETARVRRLLAIVVLIAFAFVGLVVLGLACGKRGETREATTTTTASVPAPTQSPAVEREEKPSIRDAAAPGEAAFTAVKEPFDARLDNRGRIWILDSANSRLQVFDRDGGFLGGWGGLGSGKFSFRNPEGLAISGSNIYVADTWNGRVDGFTITGDWVASASGLYGPRGVAVAPDGSVWVTDTGNGRLMVYDAALRTPRSIGKLGAGPGQFDGPVGIAIAPSGKVYVSDAGNRRIQALDKEGKPLSSWSLPWLAQSWQARLATDQSGNVYLSNPGGSEVLSWTSSGATGRRWNVDDSGQQIVRPVGLAVDRKSNTLYVIDTATHKVLRLRLSGPQAR